MLVPVCSRHVSRFPSSTLLPFYLGGLLLKPSIRKKGTLMIKGLLGEPRLREKGSVAHRKEP